MKNLRQSLAVKTLVLVLVFAFSAYILVSKQWTTDWALLSKAGPLPISLEQAPKLFEQCSRQAPTPEGEVWIPQDREVSALEQRLGYFFAQNKNFQDFLNEIPSRLAALGLDAESEKYRGQFVGFERDGKKFIYASYLVQSIADDNQQDDNAIILCDGGAAAWGIVYDLQRSTLGEFEGNRGR